MKDANDVRLVSIQNKFINSHILCVLLSHLFKACATGGILYSLILFCIGMPCLIPCSYRTKLKARYNLVETPAPDWLTHCFCEPCALCQAYRELNLRGMDPAIGWQGNLQRQQQSVMMTPPMQDGMMHR